MYLIEYIISIWNPYVQDFNKWKYINQEELGPEKRINFHDNAVKIG